MLIGAGVFIADANTLDAAYQKVRNKISSR
jgi:hypothetical protein